MLDYVLNTRLSLVVNEVWVDEKPISLLRMKNQQKIKALPQWHRCGKCGAIDKNVGCLCCNEVETVKYFELLGMRYSDLNEFKAPCEIVHF